MMSERTDPSLRLAPCSSLSMRWTWPLRSRMNGLRVRVRSRSACTSAGGTKLGRIRPCARRSASQVASFTSVLRPGTALTWAALARASSRSISSHSTAQHSPDRLPVHAGRLHHDVRDAVALQPRRQTLQVCGRGGKRLDVAHHARAFGDASAGHDTVLVDVEAGAAGMQNLHGHLPCGSAVAGGARGAAPAVKPRWVDSNMRAPALAGLAQSGVREGLTGQTKQQFGGWPTDGGF